jgi:CRISPR-associated protein Cas2
MRKTYLVCYDISDEKRLARVAKTMRGYGERVQYSVFECQLNGRDLARCRADLSKVIDHRKDQILFVDLGPSEGRGDRVIVSLGRAYSAIDAPCIIAG